MNPDFGRHLDETNGACENECSYSEWHKTLAVGTGRFSAGTDALR
jgi:hypothetical protein